MAHQIHTLSEQELKDLLLTKARVAIDMNPSLFERMCMEVFSQVWGSRYFLERQDDGSFELTITAGSI